MNPNKIVLVVALALPVAACDRQPSEATTAVATEYMAVGVFNSANRDAGTVNISHAPVPSAGWPAMTMDFKLADPTAASGLTPGERVDVHFTIEGGMNATITSIKPIADPATAH